MVDINIQNGQGISQALAEYAKNLNGGKALKINAKQWQSILATVNDINNGRQNNNAVFSGNGNIFGSTKNNFVVQQGKLSFSNEEMTLILKQMGLSQDVIDNEFSCGMNIKGLSIEKSTPAPIEPKAQVTETNSAANKVTQKNNTDKAGNSPISTPPAAAFSFNSIRKPQIDTSIKPLPVEISSNERAKIQENIERRQALRQTQNEITFFDSAENVKFYNDGSIKSFDLNVSDLDWSKKGRHEWNQEHKLVTDNLREITVKNSSGEPIANYSNGKYFVGSKEVSLDKFQKFAAKKGDIITMNYKPEISTIDNKHHARGLLIESSNINLDKLKNEKIAPIAQKAIENANSNNSKTYTKKVLTPEFYQRVSEIAQKINCKPEVLLAVMNSESGLNANARNRYTGATGLIQFMPKTAQSLGTSVEDLAQMNEFQQLDFVEKYLVNAKRSYIKGNHELSAGDVYGLIFLPAKSGENVLAVEGTKRYRQNKGLDYDGDGVISRDDLTAHINTKMVDVKFEKA